jgi:hypothetical protein
MEGKVQEFTRLEARFEAEKEQNTELLRRVSASLSRPSLSAVSRVHV